MGPKRMISEADEQIIKQGCLIKSPPSYIFTKKASWKGRLLKLCRMGSGSFVLRYYAYNGVTEDWKGDIYLSDIKSIEVGNHTMERIPTITRLFNNCPDNVLCIKTDRRDYYLLDDSSERISEWQKCITDAWMTVCQRITEDVSRPKSYPEDYPCTETAYVKEPNRQRSHTDPESRKSNLLTLDDYRDPTYETPSDISTEDSDAISERQDGRMSLISSQLPLYKIHQPQDGRRHSLQADLKSNRLSDDMTDPAYGSEPESIYDTPRSIPMKMSEVSTNEQEETSDLDSEECGLYEKMSSIVIDEDTTLPSKLLEKLPDTPIQRDYKPQRSQLKKAHLLRMMYEPRTESDLVSIKLTVETENLQKYLGLQEIGERLCVSKWQGPLHIGCLFHHGDQIDSINGFRPGSKDLFFQMLSSSISNEVNLVLTRNMKAAVFHLEGCSCGGS